MAVAKAYKCQSWMPQNVFYKLWLQACINSLYKAGIDNHYLKLLYIQNKNKQVAVKINNKLTESV